MEAPGEITREVEALLDAKKRRVHERVGSFVVHHWQKMLSGAVGAIGGAGVVFGVLHGQVADSKTASDKATSAATDVKLSVADLKTAIAQLATQKELQQVRDRVKELEAWKCYAQQYRSKHARAPDDCMRAEEQ